MFSSRYAGLMLFFSVSCIVCSVIGSFWLAMSAPIMTTFDVIASPASSASAVASNVMMWSVTFFSMAVSFSSSRCA